MQTPELFLKSFQQSCRNWATFQFGECYITVKTVPLNPLKCINCIKLSSCSKFCDGITNLSVWTSVAHHYYHSIDFLCYLSYIHTLLHLSYSWDMIICLWKNALYSLWIVRLAQFKHPLHQKFFSTMFSNYARTVWPQINTKCRMKDDDGGLNKYEWTIKLI